MNDTRPTHLDLFSGIGGFSIAFEAAGFRTVGFAEIEPYPSAVLKKHWHGIPNAGDVRNVTEGGFGGVDIITGGFPCQPFSFAGDRRGDSDERFLWPELVRICGELLPPFAFFENVPGLLCIDQGRTFNRVLSDLCSLGYDCLWNCVPACAVGANHIRDRVWILAYSVQGWERRQSRKGEAQTNARNSNGVRGLQPQGRLEHKWGRISDPTWWSAEPFTPRVDDGVSNGAHRRDALGNAIVPQVAFIFAQAIYKQLRP